MYSDHFGFHKRPFDITIDSHFFFTNPAHDEAYAALRYGVYERRGCLVLIGEAGTGKTTLLRYLMDNLDDSIHVVFFDKTTLTFEELLDSICQAFDLPVKTGRRLEKLQALNEFLLAAQRHGGTGVLIIDEAQNLTEEQLENLRLLSNFEAANEKLLQILLVGQPELEKKLEQTELRQLKQRIVVRCRLNHLKPQYVGSFIRHRLRVAGCEWENLFTEDAIQRIALYSDGIPRLINILCDNALLSAYSEYASRVSAKIIEEVAHDLRLDGGQSTLRAPAPSQNSETFSLRQRTELEASSNEPPVDSQLGSSAKSADWPQKEAHSASMDARFREHDALPLQAGIQEFAQILDMNSQLFPSPTFPVWVKPVLWGVGIVLLSSLLFWRFKDISTIVYYPLDRIAAVNSLFSSPMAAQPQAAQLSEEESRISSLFRESEEDFAIERPPEEEESTTASLPVTPPPSLPLQPAPPEPREAAVQEAPQPPVTQPAESAPPSNTPASEWKGESVTIRQGDTISEIAMKMYGSQNILAFDLIKELNPHIENLNRLVIGERVWFPALIRETLIRQQDDGSYQLILGAFVSEWDAARAAATARRAGYTAIISRQRVYGARSLYRVTLEGLEDLTVVERAWRFVNLG